MAANDQLTLYAESLWISPYVFSSFVALREKGLRFEVEELSLIHAAAQQPAYRDRSLTAKVPALEHNGFWLSESSVIAEYLDDAFTAPHYPRLFPEHIQPRARARQLMAWLRFDLAALREERPTSSMFYDHATARLSAEGEAAAANLLRVAGQLLAAGATALFGPWCLADAELSFMLHRLILNGHDIPPRLRVFAEAQWARPSVQEFVQHPRPATLPPEYAGSTWPHTAPAPKK